MILWFGGSCVLMFLRPCFDLWFFTFFEHTPAEATFGFWFINYLLLPDGYHAIETKDFLRKSSESHKSSNTHYHVHGNCNQGSHMYKTEIKCTKHKRHKSSSKLYKDTKPQTRFVFFVPPNTSSSKWICTKLWYTKHKTELFSAKIRVFKSEII